MLNGLDRIYLWDKEGKIWKVWVNIQSDRKGKIGKTILRWWRAKIVGDNNHLYFLQFGVWIWIMSHDNKHMSSTFSSFDDTLLQKTIK